MPLSFRFLLGSVLLAWASITSAQTATDDSLYRQLGGQPGLVRLMDDFMQRLLADARMNPFFKDVDHAHVKAQLVDQFCEVSGGPCKLVGPDMKKVHAGFDIDRAAFNALVEVLQQSMDTQGIAFSTQNRLLAKLAPMHRDIVNVPDQDTMKQTALAFFIAAALPAQAAMLELTVTDRDGKPAPDVVVLVNVPGAPAPKPLPAPLVVGQQDLKFTPFLTVVPAGSTLRFTNKDAYDHHVRSVPSGPLGSMPAAQHIELRLDAAHAPPAQNSSYGGYEQAPAPARKKSGTSTADVKLDQPGPIGLGCHIHGSMRGQVYVSGTPWFGKTDDKGQVHIDGVPEGAADVVIWHPDQLADQAGLKLQFGAAPMKAGTQLNFTPRKRRV